MKKLMILLVILFTVGIVMPSALADFGLATTVTTQATCATDTVLYIVQVTNTGSLDDSFTVSLSGDAAEWAVAAPAGFNLRAGEIENVYVYVTPSSGALIGTYDLKVIVNGQHSGKQSVNLETAVANCHSVALETASPIASACVCTMANYPITITNTGKYSENFELSLSGNAEQWATISDSVLRLKAGESKQIFAYLTTDCDAVGEYRLTVNARSQNSNALTTQELVIVSEPCYDFDISPEVNYLSFCENTEVKIPVVIKNEGTADNTYTLRVDGPNWATMELNELSVGAESEKIIKLVLFPEYGVAGDFNVKVTAVGGLGDVATEKQVTANVLTCHATDLKLSSAQDTVCPFTSKNYEVSVANTGDYIEHYSISVIGADWATVDETFVELSPGAAHKVNLEIHPKDVPAGDYLIDVIAESQDSCGTTDKDTIRIAVTTKEKCFGVQASAALDAVQVAYGEGALVPIVIENKGTEKSKYYLDVSGTGASYAQLNPATVELEGREAETIYLYIAVPESTPQTKYSVTVSARLEDGTVSSSASTDILVVPSAQGVSMQTPKLPELKLPDVAAGLDREEIKSNIAEKISGLTTGISEKLPAEESEINERMQGLKGQIDGLKDKSYGFLFTKTYWFYNWLWILIIVIVFAIIGAAIKALPDDNNNKGENKKKGKGGFWKKIEDFLEEDDED